MLKSYSYLHQQFLVGNFMWQFLFARAFAYGSCTRRSIGSQNLAVPPKRHYDSLTRFFFEANKSKDNVYHNSTTNSKNRFLYARWLIDLPRFQGARPDHVRVESSCCSFPGSQWVLFTLASYGHVTRFSPIGKRIWVGRYNNFLYHMMVYWLSWKLNEWIGNEVSLWLTFHTARWRHWHAQKSQEDNAKCKLHGEWMAFPRTRDLQNKTEINHDKIDHS